MIATTEMLQLSELQLANYTCSARNPEADLIDIHKAQQTCVVESGSKQYKAQQDLGQ
jgi:hypothetical protein